MEKAKHGGLIALAIILALMSLLCLGGALPNIDGPFEASSRCPYSIAFAFFGSSAIICYQIAVRLPVHRIVIEALLVFVVFLCIGLGLAG